MRRLSQLGAMALCAAATAAIAQAPAYRPDTVPAPLYRDGQPMVLTPPPPAARPQDAAAAAFRSRYARMKSPSMMLLWNRAFSDEVQSEYVDRTRVSSSAEGVLLYAPGAAYAARAGQAEITSGRTRLREGQPGAVLDAEDDAGVETGFTERLQSNGVRFVDRAMAMRTSRAARGLKGDANIQQVETDAVSGRSNYLIEVSQIPASDSPNGAKFRVTVKNIRTAGVLASFTSNGAPPMGRARLVPGVGGFQREAPRTPTSAMIGAELADQLMARLSVTLK
ncbi:hypothetical protein [Sandarakinorhabdus sp.]|uniref:hypothetical protein n=1 Tax=Sandarakinorhabdus sp. TaxID=1916663 RepID=UPI00286E4B3A|nr:hypothetical protein [Sandarakinorhabdus sp.]